MTEPLKHFVAYHNAEKRGRYLASGRAKIGRFFTGKPYKNNTLVGNKIWVIEGYGSPRRYELAAHGTMRKLTKDGEQNRVDFQTEENIEPINVSNKKWFLELFRQQQSFRNGFNRVADEKIIASLEHEWSSKQVKTSAAAITAQSESKKTEEVDALLRRLIGDEHFHEVIDYIAQSIEIANDLAPEKWGIRIKPNGIMLKVGFVETLQVRKDLFHHLVKRSLIPLKEIKSSKIHFSKSPYKNAPGCDTYDVNFADVTIVRKLMLAAQEAAIKIASESPIHTTTASDHSSLLVEVLSQKVGRRISQPTYTKQTSSGENVTDRTSVEGYWEGAAKEMLVNRYERDPKARKLCIEHYGTNCSVCQLSLSEIFGPTLQGIIHVHHLTPLSKTNGPIQIDPIRDLRPVCPNCHTAIHSQNVPLTIEEARDLFLKAGKVRNRIA